MNIKFLFSLGLCFLFFSCSSKKVKTEDKAKNNNQKAESIMLVSNLEEAEIASDISGVKTMLDAGAVKNFQDQKAKALGEKPTESDQVKASESLNEKSELETQPSAVRKVSSQNQAKKSKRDEKYTVKSGDTLMKISFEKLGNIYRWREIYNHNKSKIPDYNRLVTGTVLEIKGVEYVVLVKNGKPYLIKKADTLAKISKSLYGTAAGWKSLWKNNRQLIHDPNKIYAGFTLYYTDKPELNGLDQPRVPASK